MEYSAYLKTYESMYSLLVKLTTSALTCLTRALKQPLQTKQEIIHNLKLISQTIEQ